MSPTWTLAILFALSWAPYISALVNLARGRPAWQYNNYHAKTPASKALDGNADGSFWKSCMCTGNVKNAWWAVDLGAVYKVTSVALTNRGDCCPERLANFDVIVSNTRPPTSGALPDLNTLRHGGLCLYRAAAVPKISTNLRCTNQKQGRYVYIALRGSNYLTMCEVQVHGTKAHVQPAPTPGKCTKDIKRAVGPRSSNRDDAISDAACPTGYVGKACKCQGGCDGSYFISSTKCRAQNRAGSKYAQAVVECMNANCVKEVTTKITGYVVGASVSCPAGTKILSCSIHSAWSPNYLKYMKTTITGNNCKAPSGCKKCRVQAVCAKSAEQPQQDAPTKCTGATKRVQGPNSSSKDDAISDAKCPTGYVGKSCLCHGKCDGCYFINKQTCRAQHRAGSGYAKAEVVCIEAKCVKDIALPITGYKSGPSVSCPVKSKILSCSIHSAWSPNYLSYMKYTISGNTCKGNSRCKKCRVQAVCATSPDKPQEDTETCSPGFQLDAKTKQCVDRCPKFEERWDGKKCVVRCKPSQKWNGQKCVSKCMSPHKYNTAFGLCETRTCRCRASGDPHYYQYDGTRIDYMGKCKYTFTKLSNADERTKCYFNVAEKNVHLGNTRVSYVKLVDVDIEEMSFRYNDQTRKVYVNGIDRTRSRFPISLSTEKGTKIVVSYANRRFSVQAKECSFTTTYRNYYIETYISSAIGSKVEGICGTCNGDRRDDLIPKGKKRGSNKNTFSNSWSVPDDSHLQPQSNCISAEVNGECTVAWGNKVKDNNHCGYLRDNNGPFKSCIASGLVKVDQFKDSCEFDACFYSKGKSPNTKNFDPQIRQVVCKNMAAFADACGEQGVGAVWRRTDFCPLQCEANAYYSPKMYPACEKTCQQRNAPDGCTNGQPEDGCTCKNGFFRLGNDCVPPARCGCDAPDGQHIDSGKTVVTSDCSFKYECSAQGQLKKSNFPACHRDGTCAPVDGHFACKCNAGFTGNGHACKSRCKTEEKWDDEKKACVLYCPNQATKWDGKACVPRCPDLQTKWNGNACEKRCPKPETQWSTVKSACQLRCPDVNTKWDKQGGKCVDRCTGKKYWDQNAGKCTDRCADADKWDEASKTCKPRCPNHQEWKANKCVNRCQAGQKWHEPTKKCFQDPMYPKTERGNAEGAGCAIPFLYGKQWQEDCIQGDNKKWCGTTENYDKDGKWGYCPVSCRTKAGLIKYPGDAWMDGTQKVFCDSDGSVGKVTGDFSTTTGGDAGGAGCYFPFYYSGSYHGNCYGSKPWCYTNKDGSKWGYCPPQCKLTGGTKKSAGNSWRQGEKKVFCDENAEVVEIEEETVKTKGGEVCTFPFKYGGKYYGECADPAKPWCATTSDYDANKSKWDWCRASCKTQGNKKVDPGETWTHGGTEYSCGKDSKVRKNVKTSAGNCLFPFHYQSVAYEACTEAASAGKPWCYIDEAEKAYGYC